MYQATIERDRSAGHGRPRVFFREEGVAGVEKWLTFHRDRIVSCPHQPGNLKVSRDFCHRRRQEAEKVNGNSPPPMGLDEFQVMGLLRCRHCRAVRTGMPEKKKKPETIWGGPADRSSPFLVSENRADPKTQSADPLIHPIPPSKERRNRGNNR